MMELILTGLETTVFIMLVVMMLMFAILTIIIFRLYVILIPLGIIWLLIHLYHLL